MSFIPEDPVHKRTIEDLLELMLSELKKQTELLASIAEEYEYEDDGVLS